MRPLKVVLEKYKEKQSLFSATLTGELLLTRVKRVKILSKENKTIKWKTNTWQMNETTVFAYTEADS